MPDDRSWLTDDYPELRDGPPWVMEEMIMAERGLPRPILEDGAAGAAAVRRAVHTSAGVGEPVVVTGCGTSEHAAMAVAEMLSDALPDARIESRQALAAALRPRAGGVCIAVSHDGGTPATCRALEAAAGAGAATAAITARSDSAITRPAQIVLTTPLLDRSWCHTVAYASAILAGAAIAGEGALDALSASIESAYAIRPRLVVEAQRIGTGRRVITTGFGADHVSARELALKIEEGARIPATAHHLETLLHGHLAGCDAESTAVVRFDLDPRGGEAAAARGRDVDAALEIIGIPTVVLGRPTGLPPAASAAQALLAGAVALQILTLELAHLAGTNPDLIRREERRYREAANAADHA
ncbi:MAG TPA: SIS domain-containing protein [Gaiellales bacterium]|nr:SIS domain-containing protein [Gaiellales bacterium]